MRRIKEEHERYNRRKPKGVKQDKLGQLCTTDVSVKTPVDSRELECFVKSNVKHLTDAELLFSIKAKYGFNLSSTELTAIKASISIANEKSELKRRNFEQWAHENPLTYRASTLYYAALSRTREKERKLGCVIPFDITIEWVEDKLIQGCCECSGLELYVKKYTKQKGIFTYEKVHPRAASLDQIDAGKGYTKNNVRVICDVFNKMFNDKTDAEVFPLVKQWVESYEKTLKCEEGDVLEGCQVTDTEIML